MKMEKTKEAKKKRKNQNHEKGKDRRKESTIKKKRFKIPLKIEDVKGY